MTLALSRWGRSMKPAGVCSGCKSRCPRLASSQGRCWCCWVTLVA